MKVKLITKQIVTRKLSPLLKKLFYLIQINPRLTMEREKYFLGLTAMRKPLLLLSRPSYLILASLMPIEAKEVLLKICIVGKKPLLLLSRLFYLILASLTPM